MLKIKAVFKPCSVFHTEVTADQRQWLFWMDLHLLSTPYLLPIHILKP